jgi:hypothetical protein
MYKILGLIPCTAIIIIKKSKVVYLKLMSKRLAKVPVIKLHMPL